MKLSASRFSISSGSADDEGDTRRHHYDYAVTLVLSNHMMFPCVGVMSGKTWLALAEDERELVSRLLRKHLDRVMSAYVAKEREWETAISEAGVELIEVGPEFFGTSLDEWGGDLVGEGTDAFDVEGGGLGQRDESDDAVNVGPRSRRALTAIRSTIGASANKLMHWQQQVSLPGSRSR